MHDLACVVQLHSLHSDGTGTVPEIARAARRAKADVVLLTDHDTLEARRRGEEGCTGHMTRYLCPNCQKAVDSAATRFAFCAACGAPLTTEEVLTVQSRAAGGQHPEDRQRRAGPGGGVAATLPNARDSATVVDFAHEVSRLGDPVPFPVRV